MKLEKLKYICAKCHKKTQQEAKKIEATLERLGYRSYGVSLRATRNEVVTVAMCTDVYAI